MRYLIISALAFMLSLPVAAQDFGKGWAAYKRGDYAVALREWRPLAERGHPTAQFNLGVMYEVIQNVPQDHDEARKWYHRAAEQGLTAAQHRLGVIYREGWRAPQNYAEALKWFRKAAEQGHADAQYNLGAMYDRGLGVAQDYVKAHMWFNLAVAHGMRQATQRRDSVEAKMSPEEIAQAEKLAVEWTKRKSQ